MLVRQFCLLLLFLLISVAAQAQNWHPMRMGMDYGYKLGSDSSISLGKRAYVLSVNTKAPGNTTGDTLYSFNFTFRTPDTANFPLPASCLINGWELAGIYGLPGNAFGSSYRRNANALVFYRQVWGMAADSCLLPLNLAPGDTFGFSEGVQGLVTGREAASLPPFGADSLITYLVSGQTVILSKNLGLIQAFNWGGINNIDHSLAFKLQIIPELNVGTGPIQLDDYYPYRAGDSLAFGTFIWRDQIGWTSKYSHARIKFLSRTLTNDTVTTTFRRWSYTYSHRNPDTATLSPPSIEGTMVVLNQESRSTFGIGTGEAIPMADPLSQPFSSFYVQLSFGTQYLLDNKPVLSLYNYRVNDMPGCPYKSYSYMVDADNVLQIAPGFGIIQTNYHGWIDGDETLEAYCHVGDSCPMPPLPYVGIKERITVLNAIISPNPASTRVLIDLPSSFILNDVHAVDALGRSTPVRFGISGGKADIDVQSLPKGLYQLRASGASRVYTGRFVKE